VPNVVQAENGAAGFEALKAQAVAARTFLYHRMNVAGAIFDGTQDQVYSDGKAPLPIHQQAAAATEREILRFAASGDPLAPTDRTIAAFYVAGARPDSSTGSASFGVAEVPPDADPTQTEPFVTYNQGRFGNDIDLTPLGFIPTPPAEPIDNPHNRGAMSQNGSDFLSDNGWNYVEILGFYYGADIRLEMAETPASGQLAAPKTITDFAQDAGYFGNDPAATAGHRNLRVGPAATRTEIVSDSTASEGRAQRIVLDRDDSIDQPFEFRHLAGINDRQAFLGTPTSNLSVEPIGSFSVRFKTTQEGIAAAVALDDSESATALGRSKALIADGAWHEYEWFLADPARWTELDDGDFELDTLVSLDSIRLFGATDAMVFMDDVKYNPAAVIPEPQTTAVAMGVISIVASRRGRTRPAAS